MLLTGAVVVTVLGIAMFLGSDRDEQDSLSEAATRESFDARALETTRGAVPAAFPFGLPIGPGEEGFEIVQSTGYLDYTKKTDAYTLVYAIKQPPSALAESYKKYLDRSGYEDLRSESRGGSLHVTGSKGYEVISVRIEEKTPVPGDSRTMVTLSYNAY